MVLTTGGPQGPAALAGDVVTAESRAISTATTAAITKPRAGVRTASGLVPGMCPPWCAWPSGGHAAHPAWPVIGSGRFPESREAASAAPRRIPPAEAPRPPHASGGLRRHGREGVDDRW